MVAWRNPFGLASHPRCSAPHESSRDSFQLCRACSSSMASAIVERTVVGVIESRGAVLCLGCSVVSGMGSGVRFSVDAKRARPSSMLGWKCTAPLQLRNVWLGFCGSLLSPVAVWHQLHTRPGLALRHAGTLVGAPERSLGGREAAVRSLAALRLP